MAHDISEKETEFDSRPVQAVREADFISREGN